MPAPTRSSHPDHAREQAYIERAHRAELARRDRLDRSPESASDKVTAREMRKRALDALQQPVDLESLCFGRIDIENGRSLYLGRRAVQEDTELLVINWRLPVAAPFYEANVNDSRGLARRRRFDLDDLRLLSIVDETFAGGATPAADRPPATRAVTPPPAAQPVTPQQPISAPSSVPPPQPSDPPRLQEPQAPPPAPATPQPTAPEPTLPTPQPTPEPALVDAILADMDRARGAEMRDIVATIEARQYELISDDIDGVLAIQGGPGSGKTAIALHRAAWLLFTHQHELERSGALIVGPNRAFMDYIARVLPSLGETSVTQSAIDKMFNQLDVRVRAEELVEVARLKGDPRMAQVVQRAVRSRVRVPTDQTEIAVGRVVITLSAAETRNLIVRAVKDTRTYLAGRAQFQRDLLALTTQRVEAKRNWVPSGLGRPDIERAVTGTGGVSDRIWPTATAVDVIRDLFNSRQRMAHAATALDDGERSQLLRERARAVGDEPWTSADIALLDEAESAIRGISATFGYVLVDEAQDLSPMQLRMVFRRTQHKRATLVGDIAQSMAPWRYRDWDDLLRSIEMEDVGRIAELMIGYRVPAQIMELASELLPRIAPQVAIPTAVREGPEAPRLVRTADTELVATTVIETRRRAEDERTLALVAPNPRLGELRAALDEASLDVGDIPKDGLSKQITLLSAEQAKGLEFDHVIVFEPTAIAGPEEDWARLYVALTRATRTLSVVFSTELPFEVPRPTVEPSEDPDVALLASAAPAERLGARFTEALLQAKFVHHTQSRRGTKTPYFAHLQAVCALVLEDGGSEDEAIAALLHDTVEDHGPEMVQRIVDQFGNQVARIVVGCTDPDAEDGATWRDLKTQHMRDLEAAGPLVRRVSLAEKLDNARAVLRDYRRLGDDLWERMDVRADDLLWYVTSLADLFATERPGDMAFELKDTVARLMELASPLTTDQPPEEEQAIPAATSL